MWSSTWLATYPWARGALGQQAMAAVGSDSLTTSRAGRGDPGPHRARPPLPVATSPLLFLWLDAAHPVPAPHTRERCPSASTCARQHDPLPPWLTLPHGASGRARGGLVAVERGAAGARSAMADRSGEISKFATRSGWFATELFPGATR